MTIVYVHVLGIYVQYFPTEVPGFFDLHIPSAMDQEDRAPPHLAVMAFMATESSCSTKVTSDVLSLPGGGSGGSGLPLDTGEELCQATVFEYYDGTANEQYNGF